MTVSMTVAQVESDEGAITFGEVTGIYLFRSMIELMSVANSQVSVQIPSAQVQGK